MLLFGLAQESDCCNFIITRGVMVNVIMNLRFCSHLGDTALEILVWIT